MGAVHASRLEIASRGFGLRGGYVRLPNSQFVRGFSLFVKDDIYVAGHRGMVGAAIVRRLRERDQARVLTRTHAELDLTDPAAVDRFFAEHRPAQVYLAAAKVGGIWANNTYPAEFIYQNLMIEANVIQAAHRHGVERLLFLGSPASTHAWRHSQCARTLC